ncbi:hypothetical protein Chor_002065 [Crotalus horridus]
MDLLPASRGQPTPSATLEASDTTTLLGKEPLEDYGSLREKDPRRVEKEYYRTLRNQRLLLACFAAVLGNFSFGFALVYTSPVIPALVKSPVPNLQLTRATASWFGSIFTLGVAAGGLCTMYFNDRLGRKLSIMFSAIPSAIGYFFMASAQEVWMLLVGRLLTGFAGGVTSAAIPVYISEISHPGIRGALGSCPQIMAVLGALFLYALGRSPGALALAGGCWRSPCPSHDVSPHLHARLAPFPDFQGEGRRGAVCSPVAERPRCGLLVGIRADQSQRSGTGRSMFKRRGQGANKHMEVETLICFPLAPEYDAVIVGGVRLASVLVAAFSMDKAGRKVLLYVSACLMLASTLTLGVYIRLIPQLLHNSSAVAANGTHGGLGDPSMVGLTAIPLVATMFFIIGYAMGWGPITWLLMAEVLPLKARGVVSGLCVLVSCAICVINLVFTYLLPETKGKSLERIESYFRTGRKSFLESFRHHS